MQTYSDRLSYKIQLFRVNNIILLWGQKELSQVTSELSTLTIHTQSESKSTRTENKSCDLVSSHTNKYE